jgi:hypothetical protein
MTVPLTRATSDNNYPCGKPGNILTNYTINQTINVQWQITKPLGGTCFIDLSTTGEDTNFTTIGSIPNCADKVGDNFQADIKLPEDVTCDRCTIKFRLVPDLSEDVYLNCADVSILSPLKKQKRACCYKCCPGKRSLPNQLLKKRNLKKRSA